MNLEVKSNTTGQTYTLPVYVKDSNDGKSTIVVYHTALENILYRMPAEIRPKITTEVMDLTGLPGIPPMFAVKLLLQKDDIVIEQIGELLCSDWQIMPTISKKFPLTICKNMAFDRAFIRYMQFETSDCDSDALFYSSSEIEVPGDDALKDPKELTSISSNGTPAETPAQSSGETAYTPPAYPWDQKVEVKKLQCNKTDRQLLIETTAGPIYYDGKTAQFIVPQNSQAFSAEVLNDMYQQVSQRLSCDLQQYLGR